ncbi:MAG: copper transporter, partial [Clostridiales bacterium]|nr:copper transporter [Clostridiales bacterium]
MVNMKYYLILLISVFLSLGIGIAVGISLESKDVLEKQHSILVQRLEEEFAVIRSENQQLKEALTSLEESERENKKNYESIFNA